MKSIKIILKDLIKENRKKADFIDIRVISSEGTAISFSNKSIEDVSKPRANTGIVRVLIKGGWGYSTFNSKESIKKAVTEAIDNAEKVMGNKVTKLAPVKPVVDQVVATKEEKEFISVSLKDKVDVLKGYNDIVWRKGGNIVSSTLMYSDTFVTTKLINSEGSFIETEKGYVGSLLRVNSKHNDEVETYTLKIADNNYKELLGKENLVQEAVEIVEKLVKADNVKSGVYTAILSQSLSGVFAHEAFGHLSEADNVYENPDLYKVMKIGRKFGSEVITIIDDPTIKGLRGSAKYDDEGTPTKKTILLDKGVLTGRLHSRETAGAMNERPTGHAKSQGASEVMPRMGVTYIKPGKTSFEDMVKNTKKGIYCVDWQAGNTDHERFTFTAAYGIEINNGKLGKMVRNVKLAGNLFDTLLQIDMVGNKLEYEGGTCGKRDQLVPNSTGGPHLRVKKVMIMGE